MSCTKIIFQINKHNLNFQADPYNTRQKSFVTYCRSAICSDLSVHSLSYQFFPYLQPKIWDESMQQTDQTMILSTEFSLFLHFTILKMWWCCSWVVSALNFWPEHQYCSRFGQSRCVVWSDMRHFLLHISLTPPRCMNGHSKLLEKSNKMPGATLWLTNILSRGIQSLHAWKTKTNTSLIDF